jgi:hypothetical protein
MPTVAAAEERVEAVFGHMPGFGRASVSKVARTVLAALFIGAVDGIRWLRPSHVVRLAPSLLGKDAAFRDAYARKQPWATADRFYAENSREDVRDEAILAVLVPSGAMRYRTIPDNSSAGRPGASLPKLGA